MYDIIIIIITLIQHVSRPTIDGTENVKGRGLTLYPPGVIQAQSRGPARAMHAQTDYDHY